MTPEIEIERGFYTASAKMGRDTDRLQLAGQSRVMSAFLRPVKEIHPTLGARSATPAGDPLLPVAQWKAAIRQLR